MLTVRKVGTTQIKTFYCYVQTPTSSFTTTDNTQQYGSYSQYNLVENSLNVNRIK